MSATRSAGSLCGGWSIRRQTSGNLSGISFKNKNKKLTCTIYWCTEVEVLELCNKTVISLSLSGHRQWWNLRAPPPGSRGPSCRRCSICYQNTTWNSEAPREATPPLSQEKARSPVFSCRSVQSRSGTNMQRCSVVVSHSLLRNPQANVFFILFLKDFCNPFLTFIIF